MNQKQCNYCGSQFQSFRPYRLSNGSLPKVFSEIVGSNIEEFSCPICGAHDRERHLKLYCDELKLFEKFPNARILHFAPEHHFSDYIATYAPELHIKADLFSSSPTILPINIEAIPYDDNSFDIVIANHVLEHVADFNRALSEINRVLKPNGIAILQTPFSNQRDTTLEDPSINTDALRLQFYGQEDHVRLFGKDIVDRFSQFLDPAVLSHSDVLGHIDAGLFGVNPNEPLFLFRPKNFDQYANPTTKLRTQKEIQASWTRTKPLASIICITYNHENFIAQAIESFLMQKTDFPFEILIGEDCSSDRTREIIESYRTAYPDLIRVYYPLKNIGFQNNIIQSMKLCKGDFIALCEGDDYWTDTQKLQKQVNLLEDDPYCVITYGAVQAFSENGIDYSYVGGALFDLSEEQLRRCHPINTLTACFRNVIGELPPEYHATGYGDLFIWSLLSHHGYGRYIDSLLPSRYRIHSSGVHSSQTLEKKYIMMVETYFALYLYYKRIGEKETSNTFFTNATLIIKNLYRSLLAEKVYPLLEESLTKILKRCDGYFSFDESEYAAIIDPDNYPNDTISEPKHLIAYLIDPLDDNNYLDLTLNLLSPISNLKDYKIEPLLEKRDEVYHIRTELLSTVHAIIIYDKAAYLSHLISYFKTCGIPVLFYLHTDVWNVDVKHSQKETLDLLTRHYHSCIENADIVVAANEYLSLHVTVPHKVITPFIDPFPWNYSVEKLPRFSEKFTVGIYVDTSTLNDLSMIAKFIQTIQKKYEKELHIVIYAINCHPDELEALTSVDVRLIKINNYFQYVEFIRKQPIDIVLVPLVANRHNQTISPLSYFVHALCDVPGIYSDWGLYKEVVQHGVTGFLCGENERDWEAAIVTLMRHSDTRSEIAKHAHRQVMENFTIDHILRKMYDLLEELTPTPPESRPEFALKHPSFTRYELTSLLKYPTWCEIKQIRPIDINVWESLANQWSKYPSFHFFLTANHSRLDLLADTIESFINQLYPNWNLYIIATTASPNPMFEEHPKLHWIQMGGSLYDAINHAVSKMANALIGFLEPGDALLPHALMAYVEMFNTKGTHLIYADHDTLDANRHRRYPQFKPDFNLDMLRSYNYISRSFVISAEALIALDGINSALNDSELYDLILRYLDYFGESAIGHYSDILHSMVAVDKKVDLAQISSKIALKHHLNRNKIKADVIDGALDTFRILYYHESTPLVSILIPTKNQLHYLRPCIETLIAKTAYKNYEIIIIDNNTDDQEAKEYLHTLHQQDNITVVSYNEPFNYSRANNIGAQHAKGEYLLLLNNDTEIIHENWLDILLSYAQRDDIGAVGPRLIYPNQTIQHAGVIVGLNAVAEHQFAGANLQDPGYMKRLQIDHNLSAVTAAAMMIKRSVFERVGRLNETNYYINFSDIDLCLKIGAAGYKILFTPHATLLHHGSVSQKAIDPKKAAEKKKKFDHDKDAFTALWSETITNDKAYNIHLDTGDAFMSIRTEALAHWNPLLVSPIPKILGMARGNDGGGFYRVIAPLNALEAAKKAQTAYTFKNFKATYMMMQHPDIIIYQTPLHDNMIRFLEYVKTHFPHVRLIFEIDDLLTNIPINNRAFFNQYKDTAKRIIKGLKFCDRMVVSTQPLKDAFAKYIDDIRIVPNYLPRSIWGSLTSQKNRSAKLRVGWAGSIFHKGDLAIISKLVADYIDRVDWVFFGMAPEGMEDIVEFHPGVSLEAYPQKLSTLDLDLALVPLEDNSFNAAKSNLRLLEFGILGWPVICSDVYPYKEAPVTRVKNRYKDWEKAFLSKIEAPESLAHDGAILKRWVEENYILEENVDYIYEQYVN